MGWYAIAYDEDGWIVATQLMSAPDELIEFETWANYGEAKPLDIGLYDWNIDRDDAYLVRLHYWK